MSRSSAAWRPSSAGSSLRALFEERLVPAARHFAEIPFVAAVREALPPAFIALLVAIAAFLVLQARETMSFGQRLAHAYLPSFAVMAAVFVLALAYTYARRSTARLLPIALAAAIGFALALPPPSGDVVDYLRTVGPSGLFLAMAVVGSIALLRLLLRRLCADAIAVWAASGLALVLGLALHLAHVSVALEITRALEPLSRLGDTYAALMLIVLVETLLWIVGIHGPAMLAAVVTPVYLTLQMQNTDAFAHHLPLPNIVVVSLFLFVFPGGAGATLPLAGLLAISRVPRLRRIGRITLVPALFNTNEPLLFGAPVVFNPYLAVPFVCVPLVLATITYWAVSLGIVARAAYYVPSSVPTIVSTYLATFDLRACALVILNTAIAAAIYFPFVRAYERHEEQGKDAS